jgi:uncharacterized protein (DUF885 family)
MNSASSTSSLLKQAPDDLAWLDKFFQHYYRRRPVNATFIGVHDYDDTLPDYSEQGVQDTCDEMLSSVMRVMPYQLHQSENGSYIDWIDPDTRLWSVDQILAVTYQLIQLAEFRSDHPQRRNPALYTSEAIFGVIALFLRDFAPIGQRADAAIGRLEATARLLGQGQADIQAAPLEWTRKAQRECLGARNFLTDGIDTVIREEGIDGARLRAAADRALAAYAEYERWLDDLSRHPIDGYACGEWLFNLYMQNGHMVDMDAEQVAAYGAERFAQIKDELDRDARALRSDGDWSAILASLAEHHPTAEGYLDRFHQIWNACYGTAAVHHDLVTWPDFPLRYTPVPARFRSSAPYLYFLPYRSPAPFDRHATYTYLVPPIDGLSPGEQAARLRTTNDSVIKLNHVVHHGAIGHHVQNYYACRAESRIGQIAAIDCASRIAMFCGGTVAEGWACYVTDLMGEVGFYTPEEAFAQKHSSLRQAARCIVDANLHTGRFSLDEAAAFYRDQVGMASDAARGEAVKNSMFPGAAAMYLLGTDAVHNLRREVAAREGSSFSLRRFHDRFLSHGAIPVSMIREVMLGN